LWEKALIVSKKLIGRVTAALYCAILKKFGKSLATRQKAALFSNYHKDILFPEYWRPKRQFRWFVYLCFSEDGYTVVIGNWENLKLDAVKEKQNKADQRRGRYTDQRHFRQ